jgi:hypothetical protein
MSIILEKAEHPVIGHKRITPLLLGTFPLKTGIL